MNCRFLRKINKMSSDVVRWSELSLQRNKFNWLLSFHSKNMKSNKIPNKQHRHANTKTFDIKQSTFILLTLWLVVNQNVSIVLSDPNVAANNFTFNINNNYSNDDKTIVSMKNVVSANALTSNDLQQQLKHETDLDDSYRIHQITVDDDILNDKDYTSTWAVHIPGGDDVADRVAREHDFVNLGKVCFEPFFFVFYFCFVKIDFK